MNKNIPSLNTGTVTQLGAHSQDLAAVQKEIHDIFSSGVKDMTTAAKALAYYAEVEASLAITYIASHRVMQYILSSFIIGMIVGILLGSHL